MMTSILRMTTSAALSASRFDPIYLYLFVWLCCALTSAWVCVRQCYQSMSQKAKGFRSEQFHCPYRFKCGCYVALSVKYYAEIVVLLQAGNHDLKSHAAGKQKSLLSVKQIGAVKRAARSAPLQVGRQVHDGIQSNLDHTHFSFTHFVRRQVFCVGVGRSLTGIMGFAGGVISPNGFVGSGYPVQSSAMGTQRLRQP